ncbi:ABC transporter substrate-binding protein [Rodentibacter trehalosifermentans]|uniref:Helical backbone metal receptor n=1 Tax=Rodentibacter trehalosifermentans TaxID=1908263 RepID=A0A1V3J4Z3_9PAST|nr:ABC transporter substrate-binding protein [Rodentibacter trehalosifermentans]OOF45929.1 helical backbone metal receptor [Rodentibacter trehalosifermentans]OOF50248.1 helical backbone metal receptor [Rodentibacter trehalosifermentans]OOF52981.1 helical backbone metal receptor [Rodentibacter trehalosifermentans]
MFKYLTFFTVLFLSFFACAEQFVSLTLCSDRLLAELAHPEQIAAQSPYSKKPLMMLDKVNTDKPTLEPQLAALLPYLDKTLLINETFYPQLVTDLKKLGAKIVQINDTPQTPEELFTLILQLGKLTGNETHAEQLVEKLKSQNTRLNLQFTNTLMISDTGIVESYFPQYSTLLNLLGLTPLKMPLTEQNFSLEKVLLAQPNILIEISDQQSYNERTELLKHPLLQNLFKNQPHFHIPMKYTYCFDHGLWKGAELIYNQAPTLH